MKWRSFTIQLHEKTIMRGLGDDEMARNCEQDGHQKEENKILSIPVISFVVWCSAREDRFGAFPPTEKGALALVEPPENRNQNKSAGTLSTPE